MRACLRGCMHHGTCISASYVSIPTKPFSLANTHTCAQIPDNPQTKRMRTHTMKSMIVSPSCTSPHLPARANCVSMLTPHGICPRTPCAREHICVSMLHPYTARVCPGAGLRVHTPGCTRYQRAHTTAFVCAHHRACAYAYGVRMLSVQRAALRQPRAPRPAPSQDISVKQNPLGERRLASVDVRHNADVSDF